jgi:cell division protein FtsX
VRNVRHGLRLALKQPLWAAAIVLSLAGGIGATVAVYAAVNAILLTKLPVAEADRIVRLQHRVGGSDTDWFPGDFEKLRGIGVFQAVTAYQNARTFRLAQRRVFGQAVAANYFPMLNVVPLRGRLAVDRDTVVISEGLWRSEFHADDYIAGRHIELSGKSVTIAGVAPDAFRGIEFGFLPSLWTLNENLDGVSVAARLAPGVTAQQAQAAMDTAVPRLGLQSFHAGPQTVTIEPAGQFVNNFRELAEVLLTALSIFAGFVLFISCANVANLQLARAASRAREFATRRALGATQSMILRQFLGESAALAIAGGLGGLLLAWWAPEALTTFRLPEMNMALHIAMPLDWRVAAFAIGVTLLTVLITGVCAIAAGPLLRDALLGVQVALSVVLIAATFLLLQNVRNASGQVTGFDPSQAHFVSIDPSLSGVKVEQVPALIDRLLESSLAVTSKVPLTMHGMGIDLGDKKFTERYLVTPRFFEALRIPLIDGRVFGERGDKNRVLVNEALAKEYFKGERAVGRKIGEYEIIGVVRDHNSMIIGEDPSPMVYQSLRENPYSGEMAIIANSTIPRTEPHLAYFNARTGRDQLDSALFVPRVTAAIVSGFGLIGLLLTGVGLYAMVAATVGARMREIGIRLALGAAPQQVLAAILRRTAFITLGGGVAGAVAAVWAVQLLASVLYDVRQGGVRAFAAALGAFAVVIVVAAWQPARRALSREPLDSLRAE